MKDLVLWKSFTVSIASIAHSTQCYIYRKGNQLRKRLCGWAGIAVKTFWYPFKCYVTFDRTYSDNSKRYKIGEFERRDPCVKAPAVLVRDRSSPSFSEAHFNVSEKGGNLTVDVRRKLLASRQVGFLHGYIWNQAYSGSVCLSDYHLS